MHRSVHALLENRATPEAQIRYHSEQAVFHAQAARNIARRLELEAEIRKHDTLIDDLSKAAAVLQTKSDRKSRVQLRKVNGDIVHLCQQRGDLQNEMRSYT